MANTKIPVELSSTPGIVDNSNATAITIDSSENVGIGCTPTGFATEIQATSGGNALKLRGRSAAENAGWLAWTDNSDNVEAAMYATANNLIFANTTSYTERMRIASDGKVSIGTTSAAELFNVGASGTAAAEFAGNNNTLGTTSLFVGQGGGGDAYVYQRANLPLIFATNDTERFRITAAGGLEFQNQDFSNIGTIYAAQYLGNGDTDTGIVMQGSNVMSMHTGNSERMRIAADGRVGIGDSSPTRELSLKKTTDHTIMSITTATNLLCGIVMGDTDDDDRGAMIYNNNGDYLYFRAGDAERMRIDSSGRLLVGKTSATNSSLLQVDGNSVAGGLVHFSDNDVSVVSSNVILKLSFTNDDICTDGQFVAFHDLSTQIGSIRAGSGTTVNYNTSSDERLKENIVDASSQLDVINNIQVREFDWKKGGHHDVGMIAQELNTVIPNVVTEGGDDVTEEPWSIDYGKLTPYLIKAIQEQQEQIEALQSEINELKNS